MSGKEFIGAMRNQTIYTIEYHRRGTPDDNYDRPMGFSGIRLVKEADQIAKDLLGKDAGGDD